MKQIKEILDQVRQGVTEATFCRAEDDLDYVVKNQKRAGSNALISEWIAGRIGMALGLPIPPIEMLVLNPAFAPYLLHPDAAALAAGPNFGSCVIKSVVEFSPQLNTQVPERLKAEILLFDWWVKNEDRSDGNSNLLWEAHQGKLHVIDHNMAFDQQFNSQNFWKHHLFRESQQLWDDTFRAQITHKMQRILLRLPDYWGELPPEWTDTGGAVSMNLIDNMLRQFEQPAFWGVP